MGNAGRVHYAVIVAASVLLTAPAQAQQTNCQWIGSTWSCSTVPPVQPAAPYDYSRVLQPQQPQESFAEAFARGQAMRAQQEESARRANQAKAEDYSAWQSRLLRGEVLQAVRNGDCALAESKALDGGDIALAAQVKSYCAK